MKYRKLKEKQYKILEMINNATTSKQLVKAWKKYKKINRKLGENRIEYVTYTA